VLGHESLESRRCKPSNILRRANRQRSRSHPSAVLHFAPLSNQLDSETHVVRRNAAWAIGELTNMLPGERAGAVPQLITLLADSDEWVRMAAARALGELRDSALSIDWSQRSLTTVGAFASWSYGLE
jgi:vesicle coat complex subunit